MITRNPSLDEVLTSKRYVSDANVSFPSPKEYIDPFTEIFSDAKEFRVKTMSPVVNAEESGEENVAFARVMVEADYGVTIPGFNEIYGIVYALELAKPVIKAYSGYNVSACTNLTIFNADKIIQQDLTSNYQPVYNELRKFKADKEFEKVEFVNIHKQLSEISYTIEELNERIGFLLRNAQKTKIGTNAVVGAARLLDDPSSAYYTGDKTNYHCTPFNLYDAVTYHISNKGEFIEKPNKTIQLSKLFLPKHELN